MTDTIWRLDLTQYAGPKYLALTRALRDAIRRGDLAEGAQLPTVRDLAWTLAVTPGTVQRAYQLATQEGLLAATVGRGTFVAATKPRLGPTQALYTDAVDGGGAGLVDLRSPHLPDLGQGAAFCAALDRLAPVVAAEWTDYPSQRGEDALRAAVADWVADRPLGPLTAEDIALTAGG
ncbi:MAG: GntR family transcriptional regulator, partial [Rhodobacteraceae bacterium]|nr:GntR family transcriptional regulator [Paracoccaceae bacterium]